MVCRGSVLLVYACPGKQQELGRAFDGHLADHHQFLCAQSTSTRSRGVWPPFMWKAILDTGVLVAEDLGAAPTPLVLAQVEC